MNKILTALILSISLPLPALASPPKHSLAGEWVMHIYLRDREGKPLLFEDEVKAREDEEGRITGTLSVPKRFTVPIKNAKVKGKKFSFEIEADEGRGKFQVRYAGEFHPDGDTFVGFGTVLGGNTLLGGFVGQRLKK